MPSLHRNVGADHPKSGTMGPHLHPQDIHEVSLRKFGRKTTKSGQDGQVFTYFHLISPYLFRDGGIELLALR